MNGWNRIRSFSLRGFGLACIFLCTLGIAAAAIAQPDAETDRLKRLIDQIARGDAVESAAATERLIDLVTKPVVEAIGSMEGRPVEEQLRLRQTLARLTGALHMRIFRLDLTPDDRKLFDDLAQTYPELVERLFDGDWRVRKAAVRQIPLEPNTGVGLVIAAKVNDEDADVAEAALDAALALHDPVVARALTRYVQDATGAMQAGLYGPQEWELALSVAVIVQRSIEIIAAADYRESVPVVLAALKYYGGTRYWDQAVRASVLRSLGRLKDPQAAPALLEYLDDGSFLRWRSAEADKRAVETVGDVALAALLTIYQRSPEEFGLFTTEEDKTFAGYSTDDERREGHGAFRMWHDQNASKTLDAATPTSQAAAPASKP